MIPWIVRLTALAFLCASLQGAVSVPKVLEDHEIVWHRCYDGDTCTISIAGIPPVFGKRIGLRIWGIDTPEMRGKCAKEKALAIMAQEMTWLQVRQGNPKLHNIKRGKYFRLVARVQIGDRWLDDILFDHGLAVRYFGKTKMKDWCE